MANKLIIVESRAKTQSIGKIVGRDYKVTSCLGHIYDLPPKDLGIDVENGFKPQYKVVSGKSKLIKDLQKEADGMDEIILATDPDREGESIAWHLARLFPQKKIYRMTFNEITGKAISEALENLRDIDSKLVDAQQARRVLDRLVGYKISPLLWRILNNSKLSAGRVQSVALRLICEREKEIEKFVPEEYWSISGVFGRTSGGEETVEANFIGTKDEEIKITGEQQVRDLVSSIEGASYRVMDIKKKTENRRPLPPFITSTLQQDASRRLRFSASKTMMIAQQLYEGIELGSEGNAGLITYMRTDSVRVSSDAQQDARKYISEKIGSEYLPEKPNFFKSRKGTQDAHEAIRPTYVLREPAAIEKFLSKDQFQLYNLIWSRFIASQMAQANVDITRFDIVGDDTYIFRATGSVIRFDGFLKIYAYKKSNGSGDGAKDKKEVQLPELKQDEPLDLKGLDPAQHFTKPPARYTEASLVHELEEKGIGRPSTYVPIIETLKKRDYTRMEKRAFKPTKWGSIVNELLTKNFSDIVDYNFTARMEEDLDMVEEGKKEWSRLVGEFYEPFTQHLEKASKNMKFEEKIEEKCPECGADLVVKTGRYGLFIGCSKYPECRFTRQYSEDGDDAGAAEPGKTAQKQQPEPTDQKCEKCGSPMVVRSGRYGKFLACSGYPNCKNIKPITVNVDCPKEGCDGKLVPRRSKKGRRTFYGCSKYPACDFATWDTPIEGEKCPECGGMLVEKRSKAGIKKKCVNENCGHEIEVEVKKDEE
ncbi:MAG TPA: type I DNA topoisomerase [bacterium]|nr:type I DNA topoisomerase [bacterium]